MVITTMDPKVSISIFVFKLSMLFENIKKYLLKGCEQCRRSLNSICLNLLSGISLAEAFLKSHITEMPYAHGED